MLTLIINLATATDRLALQMAIETARAAFERIEAVTRALDPPKDDPHRRIVSSGG
jgi:hypothetical protein